MKTKPIAARPLGLTIVAAALSFLATIGLFTVVAGLFVSDGMPSQNVLIAERACSESAFISEREACVRASLPAGYDRRVASR